MCWITLRVRAVGNWNLASAARRGNLATPWEVWRLLARPPTPSYWKSQRSVEMPLGRSHREAYERDVRVARRQAAVRAVRLASRVRPGCTTFRPLRALRSRGAAAIGHLRLNAALVTLPATGDPPVLHSNPLIPDAR